LAHGKRAFCYCLNLRFAFFRVIDHTNGHAPLIEHLHISQGIIPAHRWRLSQIDIRSDSICFNAVQWQIRVNGDFFC
jgi:hypothetical protein